MKQNLFFKNPKFKKTLLIGFLFLVFCNIKLFSIFKANDGEIFFQNTSLKPPNIQSLQYTSPIESSIVKGAGYFLKSYADTLIVLQIVETSTPELIDMPALKIILNRSIQNMANAVNTYRNLKTATDGTPYNLTMIQKLQSFDYFGFCYSKNLNETTMWKVASYLYWGDVRGAFSQMLYQAENILKLQQSIAATLDFLSFPEIAPLLNLNSQFSDSLMFGQYCAMVFSEIKMK